MSKTWKDRNRKQWDDDYDDYSRRGDDHDSRRRSRKEKRRMKEYSYDENDSDYNNYKFTKNYR